MASIIRFRWEGNVRITSLIIVANMVPLVALAVLDWGLSELLFVYWIEWGVALVVGSVLACPARLVTLPLADRREPSIGRRRGSVSVCGLSCPVRNVRHLLRVVGVGAVAWVLTGLLAFARSGSPISYSATASTRWTVVLAAVLLACSHLATLGPYFRDARYRDTSVTEALGPPAAYTIGILSVVFVFGTNADTVTALGLTPLLVIAGSKTVLELLTRARDRLQFEPLDTDGAVSVDAEPSVRRWLTPKRYTARLSAVSRPSTRPRTTVSPDRSSILVAGPFVGLITHGGGKWFGGALGVGIAAGLLGGWWTAGVLLAGAGVLAAVGFGLAAALPKNATLVYECYDDHLVCYDRWLEEPQWRLPYDRIESVDVERGVAARIGGYGTVVLETDDDRPARLPFLREHRALTRVLEDAAG